MNLRRYAALDEDFFLTMKLYIFEIQTSFMKTRTLLLLLFLSLCCYSQSWQWGKRGGSLDQIPGGGGSLRQEETYFLATDSHKNIYGLSTVGYAGLNIDNVVKSNFDSFSAPLDIALFSFACDGSYRWSKVIGGIGRETLSTVKIDSQDNVYIAGRLGYCNYTFYPPRIDNDVIQDPTDCRLMFIAKYNTNGVLQWINRPEVLNVDQLADGQTYSRGLEIDNLGNLYWLCWLPQGTYANGGYTNTSTDRKWVILKYDTNGTFINALPVDIQTSSGFAYYFKFQRNPHNGNFYFYSVTGDQPDDFATIAGNPVTHSTFLACFDSQGNYQWKREDTSTQSGGIYVYNLDFDSQNNIYIGGKILGFGMESFLGFGVPESLIPGFVMKTNPDASQVLWSSYHNKGSENYGGIVLNGNELGYTSYAFGTNFTWGTQTLNASAPNEGQEVLLARFNKDTGACLGLAKIPGNIGYNDVGAAITADASGNYIVGGALGGTMYFNGGQQIVNSGSQTDFFVAKYATEVCSPLAVNEDNIPVPSLYPNPAKQVLNLETKSTIGVKSINIYNMLGQMVIAIPNAESVSTIDVSGLKTGTYFIKIISDKGTTGSKFVKE